MWIVSLRTIAAAEYERGKALFVVKAKIKIKAGDGGYGAVSFHR